MSWVKNDWREYVLDKKNDWREYVLGVKNDRSEYVREGIFFRIPRLTHLLIKLLINYTLTKAGNYFYLKVVNECYYNEQTY